MTYNSEEWNVVPGYEGIYEVSNFGNVRSLDRQVVYKDGRVGRFNGRLLRPSRDKAGYRSLALSSSKRVYVHRLVAEVFLSKPEDARTVNHKDGDKLNNHVSNLEWVNYQENNAHARTTGLLNQHGENTNLSKWSDQCIESIHRLNNMGKLTRKEIAEGLGISVGTVYDVLDGRSRKRTTS